MKPLLVGESNPHGGNPAYALYPHPKGCAGDRLCRLVMGLEPDDYLERFDRRNLCPSKWGAKTAKEHAAAIRLGAHKKIVLLGARVCEAFGLDFKPFSHIYLWGPVNGQVDYVLLPHPSGMCRTWHEPGSFDRGREILTRAGVLS
jgi:hypothetical protein